MNARGKPAKASQQSLRKVFASWDGFFAMGFGAGLVPVAPGTFGTIVAVPMALLLAPLAWLPHALILVMLFGFGIWICGRVGDRLGQADHGSIVWDEMVSYWLAVSVFPAEWPWLLAAFILFRAVDIAKPWPIRVVEARLKGGLGVMLDDLLAAAYAVLVLALGRQFLAFN